jgi:hypothetical protein
MHAMPKRQRTGALQDASRGPYGTQMARRRFEMPEPMPVPVAGFGKAVGSQGPPAKAEDLW